MNGEILFNQIPAAPVEMVMPPANTWIGLANILVLAVVGFFVAKEARRSRSWIPLLLLIGAALASLQEPIYDIVGAVWYPEHGTTAFTRAFNVSIPLWLIPGYAWYIGGLGNFMYLKMRDGVGRRPLWQYYLLFWLANFLLEMPGLNLGIYRYYGAQPFRVLGFPLWMAVTNGLMPLVIGALFNSLRGVLVGPAVLLTAVLVPMVVGATQIAAGWPTWLALNSGRGGRYNDGRRLGVAWLGSVHHLSLEQDAVSPRTAMRAWAGLIDYSNDNAV